MFYVGIDIAKKCHKCFITNNDGVSLKKPFNISNDFNGINKLTNIINELNIPYDDCVIGMEATGHYWFCIYTHLKDLGFDVRCINPIETHNSSKNNIRKNKSDPVDAKLIVRVLRLGEYTSSYFPEESTFSIRRLSRRRISIATDLNAIKNDFRAVLHQVFPEYEDVFYDLFCKSSLYLLYNYFTPNNFLKVRTSTLTKHLKTIGRGAHGEATALKIKDLAKRSFGLNFSADSYLLEARLLIDSINHLTSQLDMIDLELKELVENLDTVIMTIPGIGPVLGSTIIGEIGDITRFDSKEKLVAYAGLDPTIKQSGAKNVEGLALSKRGSPHLRRALWLAAGISSVHNPILKAHYNHLRDRGKSHRVAIGAVARKLTCIIFAMMRDNKVFEVES